NMGAMENKGLNVFNTKYVLAKPSTATDADYMGIESVVAHEYFHNWTGNRITCRDWFQLSLKEGLTVFRDEEFTSDLHSRPVKRIEDVRRLRAGQFAEDAGPLAHPVRPESYVEMNNFYTATVYNKGAEVIRMLHTLIGEDAFQEGMRRYIERHDGQAVTCEDFVAAMEAASGRDLGRFRLWYSQAGTPRLKVERRYDADQGTLTLTISQSIPPTPGQPVKQPMPIPLALGLLDPDGAPVPLRLEGENAVRGTSRVLEVSEANETFVFTDIAAPPVPSVLRGFSAPVILEIDQDMAELEHLARYDSEPVARWEAMQRLASRLLLEAVAIAGADDGIERLVPTVERLLDDPDLDPAFRAEILTLPSESWLGQQMTTIDVDGIHRVRRKAQAGLGERLRERWLATFEQYRDPPPSSLDGPSMGRRALKNLALGYLMRSRDPDGGRLAVEQFDQADTMTDRLAALALLVEGDLDAREPALARFYDDWQDEPLVIDKWFSLQAMAARADAVATVRGLIEHPGFSLTNPNRVRALVGAFASGNPTGFHRRNGQGYRFVAERIIELDPKNPQVAARLTTSFSRWQRYDPTRQQLMRRQLERILSQPQISRDVDEIATKSLER
ncbi:MAG: aminopeptidase N, partial [Geminicoccaceae bacterium]|nr:aminopeptidase N [Geminicoccaceae bacterium]